MEIHGCHICQDCGVWKQYDKLGVIMKCLDCGGATRFHDPDDLCVLIFKSQHESHAQRSVNNKLTDNQVRDANWCARI